MFRNALRRATEIGFIRPREDNGFRLWYRDSHIYDPKRYNCLDPTNALVQIRLYRWFHDVPKGMDHMVEKNWLLGQLFSDIPTVNKTRVGRILAHIIQYHPNFQRNRTSLTDHRNLQFWRWAHVNDMIYGLEYLMLTWLPDYVEIKSASDFEEELTVFRQATPEEDMEFFKFLTEEYVRKRFHLEVRDS